MTAKADAKPGNHICCWHQLGMMLTSYPPQHLERCCHCGAQRANRPEPPPIPEGHGPHYPRPFQF